MEEILSVEEATQTVYSRLEKFTGWKFLQSQRCLKKKVKDLELEIAFNTCKWNKSYEYVGLNAYFVLIYKKLGKLPVQNQVAYFEYYPSKGDDTYWYDISTNSMLETVLVELEEKIRKTALYVESALERDFESAVKDLYENHFEEYNLRLEFVAGFIGIEFITTKAHEIYEGLSEEMKQQVEDYKSGKRTKTWMLNPNNLKYIIDNNLYN